MNSYDQWKHEGSNEDIYSSVPDGHGGGQMPISKERKKKVKTLINVLSEVQRWRVAESKGIPLHPDRLTYEDKIEYMGIGMKHGAIELFFTLFMFPVVAIFLPTYIHFFGGHSVGLGLETLLVGISLFPLAVYLILCLVLASMWSGRITGGVIMSLLLGRISVILMVGLFGSMFFYFLYELSGFVSLGHYFVSVFYLPHIIPKMPKLRAYYSLFFYKMIRPELLEISIKLAIIFVLSGLIPIFTVGCKAWFLKHIKNKNENGGGQS